MGDFGVIGFIFSGTTLAAVGAGIKWLAARSDRKESETNKRIDALWQSVVDCAKKEAQCQGELKQANDRIDAMARRLDRVEDDVKKNGSRHD